MKCHQFNLKFFFFGLVYYTATRPPLTTHKAVMTNGTRFADIGFLSPSPPSFDGAIVARFSVIVSINKRDVKGLNER